MHRKPNKAIRFSARNILDDGLQTVSKLPLRNELRYSVDLFLRRGRELDSGEADTSEVCQSVTGNLKYCNLRLDFRMEHMLFGRNMISTFREPDT